MTDKTLDDSNGGRKYFGTIPHMAGIELDVYEHRLYCHYIEICGISRTDECYQSEKTIRTACRMSKQRFVKARKGLIDKGFITFRAGKANSKGVKGYSALTTIIDIWAKNIDLCQSRSYRGKLLPVEGVNNYPLKGSDITPNKNTNNIEEEKTLPPQKSDGAQSDDGHVIGQCDNCHQSMFVQVTVGDKKICPTCFNNRSDDDSTQQPKSDGSEPTCNTFHCGHNHYGKCFVELTGATCNQCGKGHNHDGIRHEPGGAFECTHCNRCVMEPNGSEPGVIAICHVCNKPITDDGWITDGMEELAICGKCYGLQDAKEGWIKDSIPSDDFHCNVCQGKSDNGIEDVYCWEGVDVCLPCSEWLETLERALELDEQNIHALKMLEADSLVDDRFGTVWCRTCNFEVEHGNNRIGGTFHPWTETPPHSTDKCNQCFEDESCESQQLTAEEAEVLERANDNLGMLQKQIPICEIMVSKKLMAAISYFHKDKPVYYSITDTGRAALEAHKSTEPQQLTAEQVTCLEFIDRDCLIVDDEVGYVDIDVLRQLILMRLVVEREEEQFLYWAMSKAGLAALEAYKSDAILDEIAAIEQCTVPEQSTPEPAKKVTPHTAMKNALVAAMGLEQDDVTCWGDFNSASKKLRKANVSPDEIPALHAFCIALAKNCNYTFKSPMQLAKDLPDYRKAKRAIESKRTGNVELTEEDMPDPSAGVVEQRRASYDD